MVQFGEGFPDVVPPASADQETDLVVDDLMPREFHDRIELASGTD
jgi:hypothetical protein